MDSAVVLDAQKGEADVTGAWGDPPAHRKACWGKGEQNICGRGHDGVEVKCI